MIEWQAAAYVGLSITAFRTLVTGGAIAPAVWITTGRKVYLRERLDAFLDRKATDGEASAPPMNVRSGRGPWTPMGMIMLPFVDAFTVKGRVYYYYRRGRLRRRIHGVPGTPEFDAAYQAYPPARQRRLPRRLGHADRSRAAFVP